MMCGLGGDGFAVVYDARRQEVLGLNGSGVAAAGATREHYAAQGLRLMPLEGVHSVGVPGAVAFYETMWKRWGTIPWAELWAPAIRLAEDGVAITAWVSRWIAERADVLRRYPDSARQFLPDGRPPAPGERWAAPDLARSLRAVAAGGAESFYRGELAERLLGFLRREGALFEPDDFARQVDETFDYPAIATDYRGFTVYETAPVSQGFLVLSQLNILEGFELREPPAPRHGPAPSHGGGEEARLRGSESAGRRPGVREVAARRADREGARRPAPERDRSREGAAPDGGARSRARRRHELLRRRGRGRQRRLVHPQPVGGVRLGRRRRGHRDHAEQPRRTRILAGRGTPERPRRRASGRCTRSTRTSSAGTDSRGWSAEHPAATSRPSGTPR